jgi:Mce-associated membrane protein
VIDAPEPGSDGSETPTDDRTRIRLNIGLWIVLLVVATCVVVGGTEMWSKHADDGGSVWSRIGRTLVDKHEPAADLGQDVGKGVVTALPGMPDNDQRRIADVIEASTKMVTAFLNVSWKNTDGSFAEVRSMSTGDFRKQYDKSTKSLDTLAKRVHSTETGEVDWAGYVAGDQDSATVILATSGTVSSKVTKYQPQARLYRIQLDLQKVGDRWLVNNLQFVS